MDAASHSYQSDKEVAPGLTTLATPGHTPGHTSLSDRIGQQARS